MVHPPPAVTRRGSLRSPGSGSIPNALQVEELGHLELGRQGSGDRPKSDDRWKEAAAPVDFRKQHRRDRSKAGRIDEQWCGLPLHGCQRDTAEQIVNLLGEGPGMVEVR